MKKWYPKGSEWRKWDLHVHAPGGKLYDGYTSMDGSDVLDAFCDALEASDVVVFGITDYFCFDSFEPFMKRFEARHPKSQKNFFFNLELRLNEAINKEVEEVNLHLIFNPASLALVPEFLRRLPIEKTSKDERPIYCSDLKNQDDFKSAAVSRKAIAQAFEQTYGKKAVRQDHFLVFTAANNDGIRPVRGKKRKEAICDEIDKFSDAFFGGVQNIEHYLKTRRYEDDLEAPKRPVISGSDSHSFLDMKRYVGKRSVREEEADGNRTEVIVKDVTWIKADPTFDGVKQILYEPEPGERVHIGPARPDEKEGYKVIRKIRFADSPDFPAEIQLNDNLCSIIGSRSSGKSALLAYIAHSVDPEFVEQVTDGPGQGEDYRWERVDTEHSIEWANGKSNEDSVGTVVYVRQNYLFDNSKDPKEVKARIEPVLFKVLPEFAALYERSMAEIESLNTAIADEVAAWFAATEVVTTVNADIKELGGKESIEEEQEATKARVEALRKENRLSEADLMVYQEARAEVSARRRRMSDIDKELNAVDSATPDREFFSAARVNLTPALSSLPEALQEIVKERLNHVLTALRREASQDVLDYKTALRAERETKKKEVDQILADNKDLIEKYKKNAELESLMKILATQEERLRSIANFEKKRQAKEAERTAAQQRVAEAIGERKVLVGSVLAALKAADQSAITGIKFGAEAGFDAVELTQLMEGMNLRVKTTFVNSGEIQVESIRREPENFLRAVHTGAQKVVARADPASVASEALQLTERVLFTAEMEGDKIGGFSEPTMTPGKRALFALRLILAESDDTWPLLIDQPEDDLDSRSIYDEVVPFLKEKKKERQIIMVSHNANLVIGADSEQLIVANRHGDDRKNVDGKQFNYLTGSLESSQEYDESSDDTLKAQGICEHACSILDGGKPAFESRKNKYQIR